MSKKILFIFLGLLYVVLSINSVNFGGDFDVYLDAALRLEKSENIYAPPLYKGLQYFYSPFFAMLLTPFSGNFYIIELIWLLISGILFYRTYVLIFKYIDTSTLSNRQKNLLVLFSVILVLKFLLYNITLIQITGFLLWAIFESIYQIREKKNLFLGSIILALAINIKILPIVILPYLIYRKEFLASVYTILFVFLLFVFPALFIGWEYNSFLHAEWWGIINPLNSEHMLEAGVSSQSLVGTIPVFITETIGDPGMENYPRNFLSLSQDTALQITMFLRLGLICLTLYFLGKPFSKTSNGYKELRAIGYICLLTPLIFPHQQKYAFLFILPAVVYLIYYHFKVWKNNPSKKMILRITLFSISLIMFTPIIGSDIIGRFNYDLLHHFRLLGISGITLIIWLIVSPPKYLND